MQNVEDILDEVKRMKQNIDLSIAEAELAIWYQDNAHRFVPPRYVKYKNLFVANFLSENLTGVGFYLSKDETLTEFAKIFAKWCTFIDETVGISVLDKLDADVAEADKIFITLVRQVNIFLRYRDDIEWPTEQIASDVIAHMLDYYGNITWHSDVTAEEGLLDYLMADYPNGIVRRFEVPVQDV